MAPSSSSWRPRGQAAPPALPHSILWFSRPILLFETPAANDVLCRHTVPLGPRTLKWLGTGTVRNGPPEVVSSLAAALRAVPFRHQPCIASRQRSELFPGGPSSCPSNTPKIRPRPNFRSNTTRGWRTFSGSRPPGVVRQWLAKIERIPDETVAHPHRHGSLPPTLAESLRVGSPARTAHTGGTSRHALRRTAFHGWRPPGKLRFHQRNRTLDRTRPSLLRVDLRDPNLVALGLTLLRSPTTGSQVHAEELGLHSAPTRGGFYGSASSPIRCTTNSLRRGIQEPANTTGCGGGTPYKVTDY